jgi:cysteine synthase A
MSRIYADNAQSIGNTPLVRLNRVVSGKATVLAKVEGRNPSYSIKCRLGAALVWDAEKRGVLKPGVEMVEPTSGNTGIALAFVAAARGYALTLTMPETMSLERRRILAMLGARVVLTPGSEGMGGAIRRAEAMVAENPGQFYMPQQFSNPVNPAIHEETTGPEIWKDTDGTVDALVAGVGTGGTITGITRYLKRACGKAITSVAVEPLTSPVITQHLAGQAQAPGAHGIQGIGAGFLPSIFDTSLIDRVETIATEEAVEFARRLAREEGILAGISSGAAVAAASRLSFLPEFAGKTLVVILPDAGERYISSVLYTEME